MEGKRRHRCSRLDGELRPEHAAPIQRTRSSRDRDETGLHHTTTRAAVTAQDISFLLALRSYEPDPVDSDTREWFGHGRRVWTLWPHCQGSTVSNRAGQRARQTTNHILAAMATCPACGTWYDPSAFPTRLLTRPPLTPRIESLERQRRLSQGARGCAHGVRRCGLAVRDAPGRRPTWCASATTEPRSARCYTAAGVPRRHLACCTPFVRAYPLP